MACLSPTDQEIRLWPQHSLATSRRWDLLLRELNILNILHPNWQLLSNSMAKPGLQVQTVKGFMTKKTESASYLLSCFCLGRCWKVIVLSQCLESVWVTKSPPWLREQSHISFQWATGMSRPRVRSCRKWGAHQVWKSQSCLIASFA